ncbi:hypothetical protein GEMRC1_004199 [Eukaryota sp. GEM-RC1]
MKIDSVTSSLVKFDVPSRAIDLLPQFLKILEEKQESLKLKDLAVSLTTLKDVFIDLRNRSDELFVEEHPEFAAKVLARDE